MHRRMFARIGIMALAAALGCSPTKEEKIEVLMPIDPLVSARGMLTQYVEGQTPASEVTMFPAMIADVRKTDSVRAEILERGLKKVQEASDSERPAVAKKVLEELK
jgi:hypothetical protein